MATADHYRAIPMPAALDLAALTKGRDAKRVLRVARAVLRAREGGKLVSTAYEALCLRNVGRPSLDAFLLAVGAVAPPVESIAGLSHADLLAYTAEGQKRVMVLYHAVLEVAHAQRRKAPKAEIEKLWDVEMNARMNACAWVLSRDLDIQRPSEAVHAWRKRVLAEARKPVIKQLEEVLAQLRAGLE